MPIVPIFIPTDSLLKLEFTINGMLTGLDSLLTEARVHFELNKIPFAKFTFTAVEEDFEDNDDSPLQVLHHHPTDPPMDIEVKIQFEGSMKTLFKGVIKSLVQQHENARVVAKIECKDSALRLSQSATVEENNNQSFEDKLSNYTTNVTLSSNLTGQEWGKEQITHNNTTVPWDYLMGYLDSIGMMVALRNGEFVGIDILDPETTAAFVAENGINILDYTNRIDTEKRKSLVTIERWDVENLETVTVTASQNVPDNPHTVRLSETLLQVATLQRVADTIIAKSNLASITGKLTTFGNLMAKSGDYISIKKVNSYINETLLLISQEEHIIENGMWKTEYSYGVENERTFTQNTSSGINNSHAEIGQSNLINGLQIGIVTNIVEDPNNQFRIKVRIPQLSSSGEGVWARLATLNASNEMGSYFIPSIDDEVIVGCLNNNPDTPVILGSLYSSSKAMPFPLDEDNYIKGFVTKEGTKIIMDDKKKSIELSTQNGNSLTISDDEKGLVLEDENSNKITMNDQGITIESSKDLNLKATGNIKLDGVQISAEANGNMTIKGALVNIN